MEKAIWQFVGVALMAVRGAIAADPFPGGLPGTDISQSLPGSFEPSGLVWHPRLQVLFVVHDGGTFSMIDSSGTVLQTFGLAADLEGVTVADPVTDFIYLSNESPGELFEFDLIVLDSVTLKGRNGRGHSDWLGADGTAICRVSCVRRKRISIRSVSP